MLSPSQRTTILELHAKGISARQIAKMVEIARATVKKVIRSQSREPPLLKRLEKAFPYHQEILRLHTNCRGNLSRVYEELVETGADLSYPTLTAYCRRQGIGQKPKIAVGRYPFEPGQEMQHDTSPHRAHLGGKLRKVQSAQGVLCYSREVFFQCYPRFRRFECKVFLDEALNYFEGSTLIVMIDNTSVVVLRGTGASMIPVPEMEAFAGRYGFTFQAHEKGDANRSARVERRFHHFENNFLVGRTFTDWEDLNQQARKWCDKVNSTYKRHLKAIPRDLWVSERPYLKPLPIWVPESYQMYQRIVDVEGYVSLDTNRYSVPEDWIGREVEVRETNKRVEIETRNRERVTHSRIPEPQNKRSLLPEHKRKRQKRKPNLPCREEKALAKEVPEIDEYVQALKKKSRKKTTLALRQLLRLVRDYPREPLKAALDQAAHYGLYDLDRVERMILRQVNDFYFRNDPETGEPDE